MTTAMPQPSAARPVRQQADADGAAIAAVIALFFIAPLAVVLGHISRGTAKRHGLEPSAAATAATVLGYIFTAIAVIAVIVIVAAAASHSVPCDPSSPAWPAC